MTAHTIEPRPLLFLVSAPSGTGKTTLCARLLKANPELRFSVSCTTRPARVGEVDGQAYYFISSVAFEAKVRAGDFLEHAEVFGNHYGTPAQAVEDFLAQGHSVLLDLDVQGARQLRAYIAALPENHPLRQAYVDVFISPPALGTLRERLESRGKDSAEVIARRLEEAAAEMQDAERYVYRILNDDLEAATADLAAVYRAERLRNPDA